MRNRNLTLLETVATLLLRHLFSFARQISSTRDLKLNRRTARFCQQFVIIAKASRYTYAVRIPSIVIIFQHDERSISRSSETYQKRGIDPLNVVADEKCPVILCHS